MIAREKESEGIENPGVHFRVNFKILAKTHKYQ